MARNQSEAITRRECIGQLPMSLFGAAIAADVFGDQAALSQRADGRTFRTVDLDTRVYNIRDYGAKGDGKNLDSSALQRAIDTCHAEGGGTVLVPAGMFLISATELKSNVTLHVAAGGTLLGVADGRLYPPVDAIPLEGDATLRDGNRSLLYAVGASNIAIEGTGTIDGQGAKFYPSVPGLPGESKPGDLRRPHHILLYHCENVIVRDISLIQCAYHCIRVIQSKRMHVDNVYMYNRTNVNNDGFHFISAEHVTISNCTIYVQDDACALFGSSKYVTVTNCVFSTRWSVFRFGGGIAENIAVSNCICKQVYGCPIKFQGNRGTRFENISFDNILFDDVSGPIFISMGPGNGPSTNPNMPEGGTNSASSGPAIARNISFSHITGTVNTNPGQIPDTPPASNPGRVGERFSCIALNAVPDAVMENISFSHIHLTFGGGGSAEDGARRELPNVVGEYFLLGAMPAYGFYARNSRGITLDDIKFRVASPDLRPALILDHVEDVAIRGLQVESNSASESALRLINSRDVLLSATRLLTETPVFMQVEGSAVGNIIVDGGDLSKAKSPLALQDGASEGSVRIRN